MLASPSRTVVLWHQRREPWYVVESPSETLKWWHLLTWYGGTISVCSPEMVTSSTVVLWQPITTVVCWHLRREPRCGGIVFVSCRHRLLLWCVVDFSTLDMVVHTAWRTTIMICLSPPKYHYSQYGLDGVSNGRVNYSRN